MPIFRSSSSPRPDRARGELRRILRKMQARRWGSYVKKRSHWKRELLRARARGDRLARIETAGLLAGIRHGDGSLLVTTLMRQEPLQERGRRRPRKPWPLLLRYAQGHERQGQLVLLGKPKRKKAIFHRRLRDACGQAAA